MDLPETLRALQAEWNYAQREHRRLEQLPFSDRVACGLSWPAMKFIGQEYIRRRMLLTFTTSQILHDGITPGDMICLSPKDNIESNIIGICTEVYERSCSIECSPEEFLPNWLQSGQVAITKIFDERTYRRYEEGLQRLIKIDSPLKKQLLQGYVQPKVNPHPIQWSRLNSSQQHAAQAALDSPYLALIHGPPGTGKTHTAVELAKEYLQRGTTVWMLADSNAAADHLALSTLKRGMNILRLGSIHRMSPAILPHSLHVQIDAHPQQKAISILHKEIDKTPQRQRRPLYKERNLLRNNIQRQLISNADIIVSTLGSIGRYISKLPECSVAIIDEATQAMAPAILAVIPFVEKCILIGDPKQLGPVVTMPNNPLSIDLFSRLIQLSNAPILLEQRRMNKHIMALIADSYGPEFHAHTSVRNQHLKDHLDNFDFKSNVLWIDTVGSAAIEQRDPITFSLYNETETEIVVQVIDKLLHQGVTAQQIGIITPYSAQKTLLRKTIPGIESNSVNAFQGREKDVILCSFVRSNLDGDIGFVEDQRRLLVAITRAKYLWIGIGDSGTLGQHTLFNDLFNRLELIQADWQTSWDWIDC